MATYLGADAVTLKQEELYNNAVTWYNSRMSMYESQLAVAQNAPAPVRSVMVLAAEKFNPGSPPTIEQFATAAAAAITPDSSHILVDTGRSIPLTASGLQYQRPGQFYTERKSTSTKRSHNVPQDNNRDVNGCGDLLLKIIQPNYGYLPRNLLEDAWVDKVNTGDNIRNYFGCKRKIDVVNVNTYLYSLTKAPNPSDFLELLRCHEAAGLYLGQSTANYGPTLTEPKKARQFDFLGDSHDINLRPDISARRRTTYDKRNVFGTVTESTDHHYDGGNPPGAPERIKILDNRYHPYQGIGDDYVVQFMDIVLRFRELVMRDLFDKSTLTLDAAKLEDLATTEAIYQSLLDSWDTDYQSIRSKTKIFITSDDYGRYDVTRSLDQIGFKLRIPDALCSRYGAEKYKGQYISIVRALELQYEACAFLVLCNLPKLAGRIAQLSEPNAIMAKINNGMIYDFQSKSMRPPTWVEDPFNNPFLIFDPIQKVFINTAGNASSTVAAQIVGTGSGAQQPVAVVGGRPVTGYLSTNFIPLASMLKAPEIFLKYNRVASPNSIGYSPNDRSDGPGSTSAPLLLAAAAAAGYFLLNR